MMTWLESWVMRSWWLILFALLCFGLYEQGVRSKERDSAILQKQLAALDEEYAVLMETQEQLRLQVNSHSDPDWIELVLMRGLGLVPENQTKVFFSNNTSKGQGWSN